MERIHNLLRKIQDVYYQKGDKQLIDIDLMLDYTRVLYADLLEWRRAAGEQPLAEQAIPEASVEESPAAVQTIVQEAATQPVSESKSVSDSEPEAASEEEPVSPTEPEIMPHESEEPVGQDAAAQQASEPIAPATEIAADTQPLTETSVPETEVPVADETAEAEIKTEPETEIAIAEVPQEVVPHATEEVAAVETEEPVLPEAETRVAEVQLVPEEEALKPVLEHMEDPVQTEIHLELPVTTEEQDLEPVLIAVPEPDTAPNTAPDTAHKTTAEYVFQKPFKDVRSFIGINDKYQFMNELFSNNKTAYEATLDKINFYTTLKEAEQWITHEVRDRYNWSEEDETYQSLLATVKKYFA